eukprot:Gregarina_sp_Pseudo_9__3417@NODE_3590_length_604_cov_155_785841_g3283_i0_p1_GENE_NODE_3590_length_604_cov_155_785841_g3283_i0NODE_3590_length_604_cov_155_785841_g3283_i0_p1_ORF_typecomplete_len125_score33_77VATPase_G/PF03179_15/1_6e20VATPase_G_2/PF16999_5/6_4e05VATPase_G_2/PF16999_5/5_2e03ATPsynt_B/PF00430_18/0_0038ATPsynt_B/PF00430_18/1_3e03HrpE/PF06188_12/0_02DivIVA/PF05103_13/0_27DivIVA/PF05103_13/7_4e02CemA/PF03040_14/1_7RRF/PF01765_19/0_21RRF/PF01765_19/2_2e03_NODE_3590_length_604_cov_155_7
MANQLIQKLLEAEQEADVIVRRARENHAKKLKEAQMSAEEDIKKFKSTEEEKFQKEYLARYGDQDPTQGLEEQTKADIDVIKGQFKKHRDEAVALLISGVVRVNLVLTEEEKRQVRLKFEKTAA